MAGIPAAFLFAARTSEGRQSTDTVEKLGFSVADGNI